MHYEIEKLDAEETCRVLATLSEEQRTRVESRRYFDGKHDRLWVVDRVSGHFLLWAPKEDMRAPYSQYFFFFCGFTYDIRARGYTHQVSYLPAPTKELELQFQNELATAFLVHGLTGYPDQEPKFIACFARSGDNRAL